MSANFKKLVEMVEIFEVVFGHCNVWNIFDSNGRLLNEEPSNAKKRMFLKMVCNGEYEEKDLIHLCADEDFTVGWALTKDSFCVGGDISLIQVAENKQNFSKFKINYSDIEYAEYYKIESNSNDLFSQNSFFDDIISSSDLFSNNIITSHEILISDFDGYVWQVLRKFTDSDQFESYSPNDWDEVGEKIFDDGTRSAFGMKILDGGDYKEPIIERKIKFPSDKDKILSDNFKAKIVKFLNFVKS